MTHESWLDRVQFDPDGLVPVVAQDSRNGDVLMVAWANREALSAPVGWLNRTTAGISLASLLSDVSHELATAVLPAFLLSLGAGPAALGWIEGSADGLSALAKLWGGVTADRLRRRQPLASIGYLVTGIGTAAIGLCTSAWQVMLCRAVAWIGRGSRSPARGVLMAEGSTSSGKMMRRLLKDLDDGSMAIE